MITLNKNSNKLTYIVYTNKYSASRATLDILILSKLKASIQTSPWLNRCKILLIGLRKLTINYSINR